MKHQHKNVNDSLAQLLGLLSYTQSNGWLEIDETQSIHTHRFALGQAKELMSVVGVFCWFEGINRKVAAPLVYIAVAADRIDAKKIHRKVWSQGLVPFLIILCPTEVLIADGFNYSAEEWDRQIKSANFADLFSGKKSRSDDDAFQALNNLHAVKLRSSLFWRDQSINATGRVDQCLLKGLSSLSYNLKNGTRSSESLSYTAANGLIGKLLYIFFLSDRGIISSEWLNERGHDDIQLDDSHAKWNKKSLWKLVDDLDSIFNGSIFPLSSADRKNINADHIDLVRMVIKHGALPSLDGSVQLSFLDIDLGVLRVETLSAVYEQFLENVEDGERRKSGAYYTPPYLVDLVLDKIEETQAFSDGVRVLDPAAGSGVFLVGAYRRILEVARSTSGEMSIEQVRSLLTSNIFGVERNPDACHVAAFSLYLTMLDYVNPRDLAKVAQGGNPKKLFPSLVGKNIFVKDFFDTGSKTRIPKINCIVGNPPWQSLAKLGSLPAIKWLQDNPEFSIGNNQAAELFIWKSLSEHLVAGGVLAMLIPAKSFINPTSAKFRSQLSTDYSIVGAVNFAHLRHRLFSGAKHGCAAIFVENSPSSSHATTWVCSPLLISQPSGKNGSPWAMILDKAERQIFRQDFFWNDSRSWFDALMLRPIDRQIKSYIFDAACIDDQPQIKSNRRFPQEKDTKRRLSLLGELLNSVGAKAKRGGNSSETGLEEKYLLKELPSDEVPNYGGKVGATLELFPESRLANRPAIVSLPAARLKEVSESYRNQFSGNSLLVPRNFRGIQFLDHPKGYSSTFLGIYFDKPGPKVSDDEKTFLFALRKYLGSQTALYFMATTGRRWQMDRRNVEPEDFKALPVPLTSIHDRNIENLVNLEGDKLEKFIQQALGISGDLKNAITEFLRFRMGFQDGNVPTEALEVPTAKDIIKYSSVLERSLDALIGRSGAFSVEHRVQEEAGIGIVVAQFMREGKNKLSSNLSNALDEIVNRYSSLGSNSFTDSLSMTIDSGATAISLTKPLEYFRWTIESAYSDSRNVMETFMRGEL